MPYSILTNSQVRRYIKDTGYSYISQSDADEFLCAICLEVCAEPVSCAEHHLFCKPCIRQWLESRDNCPVDRSGPKTISSYRLATYSTTSKIEALSVACSLRCGWSGERSAWFMHLKNDCPEVEINNARRGGSSRTTHNTLPQSWPQSFETRYPNLSASLAGNAAHRDPQINMFLNAPFSSNSSSIPLSSASNLFDSTPEENTNLQLALLSSQIDALKREREEQKNLLDTSETRVSAFQVELDNNRRELDTLKSLVFNLGSRNDENDRLRVLQSRLDASEKLVEATQYKMAELEYLCRNQQSDLEHFSQTNNGRYNELQSRLAGTQTLMEHCSTTSRSVQARMNEQSGEFGQGFQLRVGRLEKSAVADRMTVENIQRQIQHVQQRLDGLRAPFAPVQLPEVGYHTESTVTLEQTTEKPSKRKGRILVGLFGFGKE